MASLFQKTLAADASAITAFLDEHINCALAPTLAEAMRYAIAGGKGLRGFLVMETARMHGVDPALSLIHI